MEIKQNSLEINQKITVKGLFKSESNWLTYSDKDEAPENMKQDMEKRLEKYLETLEKLSERDEQVWNRYLRSRVISKEWGEQRVLDELTSKIDFQESELQWVRKQVQIFRMMRLEDIEKDEAKHMVEHKIHPDQNSLQELNDL